jgi:DNA-binding transcriptional ArsR family regulator
VKFTYDRGRNLDKKVGCIREQISEEDKKIKNRLTQFSSNVTLCTAFISIDKIEDRSRRIEGVLDGIEHFLSAQQNNLTKDEIFTLKQELRKLRDTSFIRDGNSLCTIGKYDQKIAFKMGELEKLLDRAGQVWLENNPSPDEEETLESEAGERSYPTEGTQEKSSDTSEIDAPEINCMLPEEGAKFMDRIRANNLKAGSSPSSSTKTTEGTSSKASASKTETTQVSSERIPEKLTSESISSKIADYTQRPMDLKTMDNRLKEIHAFLGEVEKIVRENGLSKDEMLKLRQELQKLCDAQIMSMGPRRKYSINHGASSDIPICRSVASKAKDLEKLLKSRQHVAILEKISNYIDEETTTTPGEIHAFLGEVEKIVRENDLATVEISALKVELERLYGAGIVKVGDKHLSINQTWDASDGMKIDIDYCKLSIAKQLEFSTIFSKIDDYTQRPMPLKTMGDRLQEIGNFLGGVTKIVQQNDLSKDEMLKLKQGLRKLCGTPIIKCSNGDFPINEYDHDPHCLDIALKAESLEILLDAKACGQVGLEKNVPPEVKVLGKGQMNTVQLAHRKPGIDGREASGPIALKPCDHSKSADVLKTGAKAMKTIIGTATGSYRRNLATAGVQNMLCKIGTGMTIDVPRVIASVSAAEINGIPCIAMEMLEGKNINECINRGSIKQNEVPADGGQFICRETWTQIHDILTGQLDRHCANMMVTKNGPTAIDHDLSFPTKSARKFADSVPETLVAIFQNSNGLLWEGSTTGQSVDGISVRNYCMPPIIDRDMYNVIMAIDLDELKNMYQGCGLTRPEIDAAMARARGLKDAAQRLMGYGLVIEPGEWESSPLVQEWCNRLNSYAYRHVCNL